MRTSKTPKIHTPYRPPQPAFAHCPGCDALVLTQEATWEETRVDDATTGKAKLVKVPVYVTKTPPVNPVTGTPHACEEALVWSLHMHGLRWNTVRLVAQQRDTVTLERKDTCS